MHNEDTIHIWTDGSCNRKLRLGGIGVYMKFGNLTKEISRGYSNTTIGRMELKAVLTALQIANPNYKVVIYSDSKYCTESFNQGWLFRWHREGFANRLNSDILKEILSEYNKFPRNHIKFIHVKGHNGDVGNERADRLADYKQFKEYEKDLSIDSPVIYLEQIQHEVSK